MQLRLLCVATLQLICFLAFLCWVVGCWDVGMLDVFWCFFVFPSISILALAVVGCISRFRVPLAVMSCFLDQRYEASTKNPTFAMRNQTLQCQAQRIVVDWNWQDLTRLFQYPKIIQFHLNHDHDITWTNFYVCVLQHVWNQKRSSNCPDFQVSGAQKNLSIFLVPRRLLTPGSFPPKNSHPNMGFLPTKNTRVALVKLPKLREVAFWFRLYSRSSRSRIVQL